jgi:hypothetical protein
LRAKNPRAHHLARCPCRERGVGKAPTVSHVGEGECRGEGVEDPRWLALGARVTMGASSVEGARARAGVSVKNPRHLAFGARGKGVSVEGASVEKLHCFALGVRASERARTRTLAPERPGKKLAKRA